MLLIIAKLYWNLDGQSIVLFVPGNENDNTKSNNTIYTIEPTNLYVPVVTLSAKDNQKL